MTCVTGLLIGPHFTGLISTHMYAIAICIPAKELCADVITLIMPSPWRHVYCRNIAVCKTQRERFWRRIYSRIQTYCDFGLVCPECLIPNDGSVQNHCDSECHSTSSDCSSSRTYCDRCPVHVHSATGMFRLPLSLSLVCARIRHGYGVRSAPIIGMALDW
jgi:hypothetical protein